MFLVLSLAFDMAYVLVNLPKLRVILRFKEEADPVLSPWQFFDQT